MLYKGVERINYDRRGPIVKLVDIISKNFKMIRKQRKLSQANVADLSGIDVRRINKIERDPDDIYTSTIERLCKGLGCTPVELMSGKTDKWNPPLALKPKRKPVTKDFHKGLKVAIDVIQKELKSTRIEDRGD